MKTFLSLLYQYFQQPCGENLEDPIYFEKEQLKVSVDVYPLQPKSEKAEYMVNSPPLKPRSHNPASPFSKFSVELCRTLLRYLDPHSVVRLSQTSAIWNLIAFDDLLFEFFCRQYFHTSKFTLKKPISSGSAWKSTFQRLDDARCTWNGYALDPATNNFLPYPMELTVNSTFKTVSFLQQPASYNFNYSPGIPITTIHFDGHCRWSSLRDSLTRSAGTIVLRNGTRFLRENGSIIPRFIEFQEYELLRGDNIAIPNNYKGVILGNVMIGMYDPGHPSFVGIFIVAMEESIFGYNYNSPISPISSYLAPRRSYYGNFFSISHPDTTYQAILSNIEFKKDSQDVAVGILTFKTTHRAYIPPHCALKYSESIMECTFPFEIRSGENSEIAFGDVVGCSDAAGKEWGIRNVPIGGRESYTIMGRLFIGFFTLPVAGVFYVELD
ncbi:hypothetical protein HK098_003036 [Nowakowskiella sp. JEL0407]|nr:hypothetical protein HK098_003036 [Nowakowskiella sp. JEL0407]